MRSRILLSALDVTGTVASPSGLPISHQLPIVDLDTMGFGSGGRCPIRATSTTSPPARSRSSTTRPSSCSRTDGSHACSVHPVARSFRVSDAREPDQLRPSRSGDRGAAVRADRGAQFYKPGAAITVEIENCVRARPSRRSRRWVTTFGYLPPGAVSVICRRFAST